MTHSAKSRVAAAFAAFTLIFGTGAVLGTDMANAASAKAKLKKAAKQKAYAKANQKVKQGNNTASANGGSARCQIVGNNHGGIQGGGTPGGVCNGGAGGNAVAANLAVPIAVPIAANVNTDPGDEYVNNGAQGDETNID